MNAFTRDVRTLLSTIAALRAQHRAGITPPFGTLENLFEEADTVRRGVDAIDRYHLTPPPVPDVSHLPAAGVARVLERVDDFRFVIGSGAAARAVLDALPRASEARR